jgi:hypothetical protein
MFSVINLNFLINPILNHHELPAYTFSLHSNRRLPSATKALGGSGSNEQPYIIIRRCYWYPRLLLGHFPEISLLGKVREPPQN